MSPICRAFGILILMFSLSDVARAHSELPRDLALSDIDNSIARVRQNINTPGIESLLVDALAGPVGDDPRIIPLCREVMGKSTSTENVRVAVVALETIADRHLGLFRRAQRKRSIAEALRLALVRKDFFVDFRAAHLLRSLGGSYSDEAYQFWDDFLKNDQLKDEGPNKRQEEYCTIIHEVLAFNRSSILPAVRDVIERYGLVAFYQKKAEAERNPALKAHEEKFLTRLKELAGNK